MNERDKTNRANYTRSYWFSNYYTRGAMLLLKSATQNILFQLFNCSMIDGETCIFNIISSIGFNTFSEMKSFTLVFHESWVLLDDLLFLNQNKIFFHMCFCYCAIKAYFWKICSTRMSSYLWTLKKCRERQRKLVENNKMFWIKKKKSRTRERKRLHTFWFCFCASNEFNEWFFLSPSTLTLMHFTDQWSLCSST